jgi:hypothetical protein
VLRESTPFKRFAENEAGAIPESYGVLIASLLSIILLTLQVTDDIVRGIPKAESAGSRSTFRRRP